MWWVAACARSPALVIDHVRVFDGLAVTEDARVVVEGGVIKAVGPAAGAVPSGAEIVDGAGKTLLPGLIDAHVHTWSAEDLGQALAFGVTTELDMMDDPTLERGFRRRAASDVRIADVRFAGHAATAHGGHGTQFGFSVPTLGARDDAAAFVRARVDEGSDYIKVVLEDGGGTIPSLTAAQAAKVVDAAHGLDKVAVFHVTRRARASDAVTAGADGLVHVWTDGADPELVTRIREARMFVTPTLTVSGCPTGDWLARDARVVPFLRPRDGASLQQTGGGAGCDGVSATVRALHEAGVPVLAGTDANNVGAVHGAGLHGELASLVRAGLMPLEALAAATSLPADRFGLTDRGRIAVGKRADLVLVDGDPTSDITRTLDIAAVWRGGERFDRAAWQAGLGATTSLPGSVLGEFNERGSGLERGEWQAVTDRIIGGPSTVDIRSVSGGAAGSARALEVRGEARAHTRTFAGTTLRTGAGRTGTTDLSRTRELVFWAKGDGAAYIVWLLTPATMGGRPASVPFTAGAEWTEVKVPLDRFETARDAVLGLFFGADTPRTFHLVLDEVELR